MNLKGRPWRIQPDELEPLIRERRERGEAYKVIGHALGYSGDRIRKLCGRWKIRKRLKTVNGLAEYGNQNVGFAAEGAGQHGNHPAVSEAKPNDSQLPGTHK